MRWAGVEERLITGDGSARDEFDDSAQVKPRLVMKPVLHWSHLEIWLFFGLEGRCCGLAPHSAALPSTEFKARGLLASNKRAFRGHNR